tara:strand:+ start:2354 stop:3043 length:690 start_codon:yes stop_codon:yes gene_type:complete
MMQWTENEVKEWLTNVKPDVHLLIKSGVISSQFDQESANYLLLACNLYQEWSWDEVIRFLDVLKATQKEFWKLPVLFQNDIFTILRQAEIPKGYSLNQQVCGIFWSVGEFIRKSPNWYSLLSSEEFVQAISQEIFYFGGHSTLKVKSRRLWQYMCLFWPQNFSFQPIDLVTLDVASYEFFKKSPWAQFFFSEDTHGKIKYYTRLCKRLNPSNPLMVAEKIESYTINEFE